jgi:putative ABC transport system substrate-binding protein
VRRRDFIKIIAGSAVGWPLAVQAQQLDRMRRVSALVGIPENDPETKSRIRALRLGMRDAGWIEGRNIQIEIRYAGPDRDAIKKHVAEVIRLAPDVILANSTPVMAALQPATSNCFRRCESPGRSGVRFKSYAAGQQCHRFLIHRA